MKLVDLEQPDALLDAVYSDVLAASFPPAELCTVDGLQGGLPAGVTTVSALLDDDGRPVAAAVGDWSARSRIQLLSYLAVLPGQRSGGHGGRLLRHVLDRWRELYRPCAIVAEIEHPAAHESSEAYGDPLARFRFYARHGARALDLPYFQPALSPATPRVFGLLLISLHLDPELAGPAPGSYAGAPMSEFMREYLEMTEGGVPDDPAATALLAAMARPDGIPTLRLDDPATLAVSTVG
jgi:GNAT superfamily N-acetyltransferase